MLRGELLLRDSCLSLRAAFLDALEAVCAVSGSRVQARAEGLRSATRGIGAGVRGVP